MKYRGLTNPVVISVVITGLLVVLLYSQQRGLLKTGKQSKSTSSETVAPTEKPKPQLKSVYTVSELDSEWDILVSEDFNISIHIPKGTIINYKGGGFDTSHPEMET